MDNGFIEDGFIVNLSNAKNSAEVIYELSSILEMPEAKNKKICLKLEGIDLTQSQLLSIKALIESMDSTLEFVNTTSESTIAAAEALEIKISELKNEMEIPQIEPTEEELQQEMDAKAEQREKALLYASDVLHDAGFETTSKECVVLFFINFVKEIFLLEIVTLNNAPLNAMYNGM